MLHIFLTILKIPLFLLALVLILLLAAALLVLFVPVRYQARLVKEEQPAFCGRVSWLFHLISVRADYQGKKPEFTVRICGYPLIGGKKKPARGDATEDLTTCGDAAEDLTAAPEKQDGRRELPPDTGGEIPKPVRTQDTEPEPDGNSTPEARPGDDTGPSALKKPRVSIIGRICGIRDKIRNTYRRLLEKIKNIQESIRRIKSKLDSFSDLWYDEHTQMALTHGKSEIFYILRHYLPGKVQGRVLFGLSDPAMTGQVLGLLCILQVLTGNHLQAEADFERAVLQGEVSLKGHVRVCHLVKSGLSLLLDRHCRITFGRIRKFRSAS